MLKRGPLAGRRIDVDVVEGRPPGTKVIRCRPARLGARKGYFASKEGQCGVPCGNGERENMSYEFVDSALKDFDEAAS